MTSRQPLYTTVLYSLLVVTPSKIIDLITRNLQYLINGGFDELMDKMIEAENLDISYGYDVTVSITSLQIKGCINPF